jgi:nucleoside 2-deoxyribosyltransferase
MEKYQFQKLELSDSTKAWLRAIHEDKISSDRVIRLRLLEKLDNDFNPEKLHRCLVYEKRQLSLIALWHLDSDDPIFKEVDSVVRLIWGQLKKDSSTNEFTAEQISSTTKIPVENVERVLGHIYRWHRFSNGGQRCDDEFGFRKLYISDGFDAISSFMQYQSVFDEMEKLYTLYSNDDTEGDSPAELMGFPSLLGGGYYGAKAPEEKAKDKVILEPNTAFIIMPINRADASNEDVHNVIKETFLKYEIDAKRADEFQHSDEITKLILNRIKASEYLIADLSNNRPNVYYEIGYAHAIKKKPIFICKEGTDLHFDIKGYNTIFYSNMTELKKELNKRLASMTNKNLVTA